MATTTATKAPGNVESLRDFMSNLVKKKSDNLDEAVPENLADNLAFILQSCAGRDVVLDHSRISLVLGRGEHGNCHLFLVYDEKLVMEGGDGDDEYGLLGLFERSKKVVAVIMQVADRLQDTF